MSEDTAREKVKLNNVRIGYPYLWTAKKFDETSATEKPAYSCRIYLNKKTDAKQIAQVKDAIERVKKGSSLAKVAIPEDKICLREVPADKIDEAGMIAKTDMVAKDTLVLVLRRNADKGKPAVVNKNPKQIIEEKDDLIYGGCMVNVSFGIWPQNNKFGKRINAQLEAVQYAGDADRFGAAPPSGEAEFSNIEEDEDDPRA